MITWWMKLGGNLPLGHDVLSFFYKWHRIFYKPSRTDTTGHTKAFDYPVMDHWGKSKCSGTRQIQTDDLLDDLFELLSKLSTEIPHLVQYYSHNGR